LLTILFSRRRRLRNNGDQAVEFFRRREFLLRFFLLLANRLIQMDLARGLRHFSPVTVFQPPHVTADPPPVGQSRQTV